LKGHHENSHPSIPLEVEVNIRKFVENYPSRESHYSGSVKTRRKYLGTDKNIASLHREFLGKYTEYENYVKYQLFKHIFKDCNVGFGYPRADICTFCEELSVKILNFKKSEDLVNLKSVEYELKEHQNQADYFYTLQRNLKNSQKSNLKLEIICVDYEKNFYLPKTNVSTEYYSRQLSLHNFGIHNMKNGKAFMFIL